MINVRTGANLLTEVTSGLRASDLAMAMVGLFVFSSLLNRLSHRGPMILPVLGIAPILYYHIDDVYDWLTDSLVRAGGTFSYFGVWFGGVRGVVTLHPANVEYVLKTRFANFPKGRRMQDRFTDFLGGGIFNADDGVWREQRGVAVSEMHSVRFSEYSAETVRDLVHGKLLPLLGRLEDAGRGDAPAGVVDLQDLLLRFAFDNICAAAFGVDPGCLAPDHLPDVPFARAFEQAAELTSYRFILPPFVWKLMRLLGVGPERRLRESVRVVHEFTRKMIADRRAEFRKLGGLSNRSDLLSRLVEADAADGFQRFSDEFINDLCISFILAGRDTSSVALTWFFWLLHDHPRVEDRILDEIHSIVDHRRSSSSSSSDDDGDGDAVVFTVEELTKMDYLQAALSEAMRLYPPVPVDFKEAVEDDVLPADGTRVGRGWWVVYSIISMGRNEGIWGKDCREFRPERWIDGDGRFVKEENHYKYPVFNGGPRLCVGKRFAYMQMKMVAASVLMRYSVTAAEGRPPVAPKLNTTLYMKNGLLVTFKPRERKRRVVGPTNLKNGSLVTFESPEREEGGSHQLVNDS